MKKIVLVLVVAINFFCANAQKEMDNLPKAIPVKFKSKYSNLNELEVPYYLTYFQKSVKPFLQKNMSEAEADFLIQRGNPNISTPGLINQLEKFSISELAKLTIYQVFSVYKICIYIPYEGNSTYLNFPSDNKGFLLNVLPENVDNQSNELAYGEIDFRKIFDVEKENIKNQHDYFDKFNTRTNRFPHKARVSLKNDSAFIRHNRWSQDFFNYKDDNYPSLRVILNENDYKYFISNMPDRNQGVIENSINDIQNKIGCGEQNTNELLPILKYGKVYAIFDRVKNLMMDNIEFDVLDKTYVYIPYEENKALYTGVLAKKDYFFPLRTAYLKKLDNVEVPKIGVGSLSESVFYKLGGKNNNQFNLKKYDDNNANSYALLMKNNLKNKPANVSNFEFINGFAYIEKTKIDDNLYSFTIKNKEGDIRKGLANKNDQILLTPIAYDIEHDIENKIFIVKKYEKEFNESEKKFGIINYEGKTILPFDYLNIVKLKNEYFDLEHYTPYKNEKIYNGVYNVKSQKFIIPFGKFNKVEAIDIPKENVIFFTAFNTLDYSKESHYFKSIFTTDGKEIGRNQYYEISYYDKCLVGAYSSNTQKTEGYDVFNKYGEKIKSIYGAGSEELRVFTMSQTPEGREILAMQAGDEIGAQQRMAARETEKAKENSINNNTKPQPGKSKAKCSACNGLGYRLREVTQTDAKYVPTYDRNGASTGSKLTNVITKTNVKDVCGLCNGRGVY